MDFEAYQRLSRKTAIYNSMNTNIGWVYPALGLAGEAGEVANTAKKVIRDSNWKMTEATKAKLKKEIGDVLWYVANLLRELDLSMDETAQANLEKLFSRMDRDVLQGSGDTR